MLILTLKVGQKLFIGDDVFIIIQSIGGKHSGVKLAISAPADIIVDREEVRIKRLDNPDYVKPNKDNE